MISSNRIKFKILESVTLGMNAIYLKIKNGDELKAVISYCNGVFFDSWQQKSRNVYKIYLSKDAFRFYSNDLKKLPSRWLLNAEENFLKYLAGK